MFEDADLYDDDVPPWKLLMGNPTNFVLKKIRNLWFFLLSANVIMYYLKSCKLMCMSVEDLSMKSFPRIPN